MTAYPNNHNRNSFIRFLEKNGVNIDIINKFKDLPEKIEKNDIVYSLNINVTWHDDDKTHYIFELNYYSEDKLEFLFPYKIFTDPEVSIDFLNRFID